MLEKPIKPKRRMSIRHRANFYFDHASNKVSLPYFLTWIKEQVPKNAKDTTIELEDEYGDYAEDGIIKSWIQVSWDVSIKNKSYPAEMKKYQKQLIKWKKQCRKK